MSKAADFLKHPKIQLALATGVSIIVLAYASKHWVSHPIHKLALALPAFIATLFESVPPNHKLAKTFKPAYGIIAVLLATALIIGAYR